jgi:hypothetical protein
MVYNPLYKSGDLSRLVPGIVMIIAASFTIWKISIGSKNVFAYVLMYFTVLIGIVYIGLALSDAFRREVELADRVHYFLISMHVKPTFILNGSQLCKDGSSVCCFGRKTVENFSGEPFT